MMQLDVANNDSIRKFVEDFRESGKKLNVLINNAGILLNPKDTKRQYSEDNYELTMGTNYLGEWLLRLLILVLDYLFLFCYSQVNELLFTYLDSM